MNVDIPASFSIDSTPEAVQTLKSRGSSRGLHLDRVQFLKELKILLGLEFLKESQEHFLMIFVINRARIRDVAIFMVQWEYQLMAMFASDLNTYFELNYLYHSAPFVENSYILIQTQADKTVELPTIRDYFPNSAYHEMNLFHRLGIKFIQSPLPMGKKGEYGQDNIEEQILCVPTSILKPSFSPSDYSIGIFHPIHKDRFYFDLDVNEGKINKVELKDGWFYKNIHSQLEHRHPMTDFTTCFDQIASTLHVHLSIAYYQGLESLLEKKIDPKTRALRIFYAELERVLSHLYWFVNFAYLLGMETDYKILKQFAYRIEIENRRILHSTYLRNVVKFGASLDISMKDAVCYYRMLKSLGSQLFENLHSLIYRKLTEMKCTNIGIISGKTARLWGLSGPVLRGSGIPYDVRCSESYLGYASGDLSQLWNVISFKEGDVFARAQVRLWELRESLEICKDLVHKLIDNALTINVEETHSQMLLIPEKFVLQTVESPQGALSVYLRTDPKKISPFFHTVRIIPPDMANFAVLEKVILPGNEIRDFPLILHSMDLNFTMIDL